MDSQETTGRSEETVRVPVGEAALEGTLVRPEEGRGVVLFAHGSGSSRHSPRNRFVAGELQRSGLGTLLIDLLTPEEEREDAVSRRLRFDIRMLAERLGAATDWLRGQSGIGPAAIGLFGASTGGGAALVAAAERPDAVRAVVSRGGRPDLAGRALERVRAPTLLVVGGDDIPVIEMNRAAASRMAGAEVRIEIVQGAGHLFEEPGKLDAVADLARRWFVEHLPHA